MKNKSTVILFAACVLALGGCSDATAGISKGSDALFSVDGKKVTRNEIYHSLKASSGSDIALTLIKEQLYKLEEIVLDDASIASGQEQLAKLKEQFGDQFEKQIKNAGYENEEAFYKSYIEPNLYYTLLVKKYCNDESEALLKKLYPVKAQVWEYDDKAKADAANASLKESKPFSEIGADANKTNYDGSEKIYTNVSTLPQKVIEFLGSATKVGASKEPIADTTSGKYYLVNVTNIESSTFADEAINDIITNSSNDIQNDALAFYLKKHKFVIHDIDILKGIETTSDTLIVQDNYKKKAPTTITQ